MPPVNTKIESSQDQPAIWLEAVNVLSSLGTFSHNLRDLVENPEKFAEANKVLSSQLETYKTAFDKSLTQLPDGRLLFTPQYEAICMIAERNRYTTLDINLLSTPISEADHFGIEIDNGFVVKVFWDDLDLTDIRPISALDTLKSLRLCGNRLTTLNALANLTDLESLALSQNRIKSIKPILPLDKLESLILDGNQIKKLPALSGLKKLNYLSINGNPFGFSSLPEIRELKARKVRVIYNDHLDRSDYEDIDLS